MPIGGIATLDQVLQFSGNLTTEKLTIENDDYDALRSESTHADPAYAMWGANGQRVGGTSRLTFAPEVAFFAAAAGLPGSNILSISGSNIFPFRTFIPPDNAIDFGAIGSRLRDLFLSRYVYFGSTVNEGRIYDDGTGLLLIYGAGPDLGIGIGDCSGGTNHIDIEIDGQIEIAAKILRILDDSFFPTLQAVQIQGVSRSSGDVCEITGDVGVLTTGRLMAIFNDGSGGPGGSPVLIADKNGSMDFLNGAGANGQWVRSPQMTAAQRNAMSAAWGAADNGKRIFNTSTNQEQIWVNPAWVNL